MTDNDLTSLPAPTFAGGTKATPVAVPAPEWWAEARIPLGRRRDARVMTGADESPARAEPAEVAGSAREPSAFAAPQWARDVGRWSWIVVGALLVLLALFWAAAAIQMVVLASLFAVLFGGTFLPVVDWLHKHRLPRWLGALLVLVFLIALGIFIALVILYGLVKQLPVIQDNLQAAVDSINEKLASTSVDQSTLDSMKTAIGGVLKYAATGAAGTVADVAAGLASLIFGVFISINILVWVLIQGRKIAAWASRHVPPVPQPVAYTIFANSARFFRGYIFGSTLVGLFNAAVIFVGALIIGVPMPGTLAIVAWMMNYIPFFGAIVSGAFAVLIAYGAGGTVDGDPDADHRHHRQRLPADAGVAVRSWIDPRPAPAGGAVRDHRRRHPVRRRGRRVRGAVREDRPRRLRADQGRGRVRQWDAVPRRRGCVAFPGRRGRRSRAARGRRRHRHLGGEGP